MKMSINFGPKVESYLELHYGSILSLGIIQAFDQMPGPLLAEIEVVRAGPKESYNPECVVRIEVVITDPSREGINGRFTHIELGRTFNQGDVCNAVLEMTALLFKRREARAAEFLSAASALRKKVPVMNP